MNADQTVLIVEDDPDVSIAIAAALGRAGRRLIVCRDAESAELVLDSESLDAVISDVKLSGPFRYEGIDLLGLAARRCPRAVLIGMSGSNAEGLGRAIEELGARFLRKPFESVSLEELIGTPLDEGEEPPVTFVPTLDELLSEGAIAPHYQPIVTLREPSIAGFEALARLRTESMIVTTSALFRYADRKARTIDLNLACIRAALRGRGGLDPAYPHFINVDGRVFTANGKLTDLLREEEARGIRLDRVVLELTEQHPFLEEDEAFAEVDALRDAGVRFAFDDVGIAYSHLPLIGRIRPAFLKISQQFGTDFERDPVRQKLVNNIVALGNEFACDVIIEGIESAVTAVAAREAGIAFAQGYHFAHPSAADQVDIEGILHRVRTLV